MDFNLLKYIQEGLFKPASEDDMSAREVEANAEWLNTNRKFYDGLLKKYGDPAIAQTIMAYSDGGSQQMINLVGSNIGFDATSTLRNLNWRGPWVDASTFIKQCSIVGGYNNFDWHIAELIVRDFPNRKYRLGREGSVVVYVTPVTVTEVENDTEYQEDEIGTTGDVLRIWWD
jgi:hypothetical protein